MDDFCHAFYAGPDGEPVIKTYTFEDLVSTLTESLLTTGLRSFARAWIPQSLARRWEELRAAAGGSFITTIRTNYSGPAKLSPGAGISRRRSDFV